MSSKEFMFYIIWTFVSIIIFPVLQYNFSREIYDPTYKEIMPELAYGIELLFISVLGVISHFRFQKLLNNSRDSNNARSITHKIRYFQELNLILAVILFIDALAFIVLSADGLTGKKTLNAHKFSADFLICNINMCSVITWFIVILIFHPKPNQAATSSSIQNPSHDFLSAGKTLDGYPASPPPLIPQPSQASSDYLQYTKSVSIPMTQPQYSNANSFQLGPLPPPPDTAIHHHNSIASSTPSTATLVSSAPNNNMSRISRSKGAQGEVMMDDPLRTGHHHHHGLDPVSERQAGDGKDWEMAVDYIPPARHSAESSVTGGVKRQKSDDSMWLHQSPRGANSRP
ncbi:hypothetical protein DFQ30_007659 [Apophysomyces sp. BC1015]|nr:hypothetical protein DFQ30_007659 [Apophysomyces sp. BC1015]